MNRLVVRLTLLAVFTVVGAGAAQAGTITFSNSNLTSLDHSDYYVWGIRGAGGAHSGWSLGGQSIVSATLTFYNIYNNDSSSNALFVHLMQMYPYAQAGAWSATGNDGYVSWNYDSNSTVSDKFKGLGDVVVSAIGEIPYGYNSRTTLTYNIPQADLAWLTGPAPFFIGIDPDCHFYDSKVEFTIETQPQPVPEPASLTLLGLGLVGVARASRRRNAKKQA